MDIKIADFGLAKIATSDHSLRSRCGTPSYVAPEIVSTLMLARGYGTKVDMWSVGVILYTLLAGYEPFVGNGDLRKLFSLIKFAKFEFHDEYWSTISDDAKDLVSRMLTVNPTKRISAAEALNSSWIKNEGSRLESSALDKNLEKFKKYNAKRKLKSVVHALIATEKLKMVIWPVIQESDSCYLDE